MREYLWPSMGLRRWLRWVSLSLLRQASSNPHTVALGVALGVWVSFFPVLGTHTIMVALLCWLLRANFLAALLGTWFGNPWTYPLMWAFSHHIGMRLLRYPPEAFAPHGGWHMPLNDVAFVVQNLELLTERFLWPAIVGGTLLGLPFALAFYLITLWQLKTWAGRRRR